MKKYIEIVKKLLAKRTAVIAFLGVLSLLLILASSVSFEKDEKSPEPDYQKETEERLQEMIESIEGVGKAKVMVTLRNNGESVYKEMTSTTSSGKSEGSVVIVNGKEGNEALIKETLYPEIMGVVVICEGGDNAFLRSEIIGIVSAAYSVSTNRIYVCKLSE